MSLPVAKKRKVENLEKDGEPRPGQGVFPNTASVILDTRQAPTYPGDGQSQFLQQGGWVYSSTQGLQAGPLLNNVKLPATGSSSLGTGTDVARLGGSFIPGPGAFGATINPLSGCDRIKYYGSFTGGPEWDTHRGNTILSLRVFIEPNNPVGQPDGSYYIKDFYIKVPDALVFRDNLKQSRKDVATMLNYLIQYRTYRSDFPVPINGWGQWEETAFSNAGSGGYRDPIFSIYLDETSERFVIQMDVSKMAASYNTSASTFVIFDDPYGLTTRGGFWTGFGYANPDFNYASSASQPLVTNSGADVQKTHLRFKSYPGQGIFNFRNPIPSSEFFDTASGGMTEAKYNAERLFMMALLGFNVAAPRGNFQPPSAGNNIYVGVRAPALQDARYVVHNSDEISYDRKLVPFINNGAPSKIGPATFGIDFKSYERGNEGFQYSTRPWGESSEYGGEGFNSSIFISKGASTMRIIVESFNDYGEELLASSEGNAPGRRDYDDFANPLLKTPVDPPFIAYCKYIYPNGPVELDRVTTNFPGWSYYNSPNVLQQSPASILNLQGNYLTKPIDLKTYYDNGARVSITDTQVHFLLNQMF